MKVMRVSSSSSPISIAQALSSELKKNSGVEMQAIGAGALNQAVKAIAIARGLLRPCGLDLLFRPEFAEIEKEGQARTALRLVISKQN
jgi:stage V sporulation protein S